VRLPGQYRHLKESIRRMIPLRLTLKNFMSYRDGSPPLDFAPIHTACLSGENGAGKSALLTAITWSLWGATPAHADDEDLIAQGETEMSVDFEFGLGDQVYRVLRSRTRKGKTTTGKLYFEMQAPDGGWRPISGNSARETQRLIIERLRMDYDTFVNSAFLRQGRADEFTTKNATERKEILAKILGLEEYDVLAERAREQARSRESDRRLLAAHIQQLALQIARKPDVQAQLAELAGYLSQAREILAVATTEAERLHLQVAALEKDKLELENVRARMAQDEVEISKADKAIAVLEANLLRYREVLAQRDGITAGYQRLQTLRTRERELSDLAHQSRDLESEIHRLERAIDHERSGLLNQIGLVERTISESRRVLETRPDLERRLAEVRVELAHFEALDQEWRAAEVERDMLQQRQAGLAGANDKLKEEADAIKRKLDMLNEAVAAGPSGHQHGRANCPLCNGLLDADALARVRASYEQDIATRRQQWKTNKRDCETLDKQIATLASRITDMEQKLKARKMAEKREATYERELQGTVEAETRLARETDNLQALQVRLDMADYAHAERQALAEANARLTALGYDAQKHRRVATESQQLNDYERRFADLRSAEEKQESDTERLAREKENREGHAARLTRERAEEVRLAAAVYELAERRREAGEQDSKLRTERDRFERLSREQAALDRELEGIASAESEREIKAAELTLASAEKTIYEDLAKAFGKGGIQAMIIEDVVPELAEEANRLLSRMTDGRMQLAFETQRQARSKDGVIETLDIKITDGAGVARKYEMFSGGEAFRINFAVRIALSRLLAHRAGAQLQTLIIDEGFGTQDAQGRERLVQAIRTIQDDFEKILVITHIDELKDEFAARIDVVKTARGSQAVVN
jgi:exonuclease SbcC